ncbi:PucR family transcriptional regulator ligand-binding domain-containing protein [Rhodococcus koreensis]
MAVSTIGDLLAMSHLRLELWAGGDGADRQVKWAQTSDLDRPWEWMTGGELLMKNGRTMSPAVRDQVTLIESLVEYGISGLVLGIDPDTPTIQDAALSRANELKFPVLAAPYSVGFGAIGRAVADQNASDESRRLVTTGRVYAMVRRAVSQPSTADVLKPLARDLACKVSILDAGTGLPALDAAEPVPNDLRAAVVEEVSKRGGALPGVIHLDLEGTRAQVVEVPDEEPTVLVTYAFRAAPPDIVLLQHCATAAAVLLAQQGIRRELERRTGAELLAGILDGRLNSTDANRLLIDRGLDPADCVLAATSGGREADEQSIHLSLHRRSVPNLLLRRSGLLYALLPSSPEGIELLHRRLGPQTMVGISDPLQSPDRASDAVREANWAVRDAAYAPEHLSRYADATLLSILRDTQEARIVVDRTLGGLLAYDAKHNTELVKTLDIYLSCNRSWQKAAEQIGVHRQTVIYRIRRVEEITSRDLAMSAHIADLWIALRARELVAAPS